MKKISSEISIGIVCAALGFMIVYQLKSIDNKNSSGLNSSDKEEILLEIDNLNSEKEELATKNKVLSDKLDEIEKKAVVEGDVDKSIKESLDKTRMILGQEDVQGEGITVTLTLKSPLVIGQNPNLIKEHELTHLVNLINFSGAQAISINGYRITQQTGIKDASNFIWIGDEGRISALKPIEVKAIGNINSLKQGIIFPRQLEFGDLINYDVKIEELKNLKIEKSNVALSSDYLKKSDEKE
ncbi:DUF881 domain-containing protein [uncultured Clostridium sp.]|uniref:DUF881 domain-containing protein n=1 Tax=uncultured Clostridium sp. TaxID=59620 RepID=UPI0026209E12|nr:DUF881 domain-containing protein [uncultured Clostridium sp.]